MTFLRNGRSQAKYFTTRTPPNTSFITFTLVSACLRYIFWYFKYGMNTKNCKGTMANMKPRPTNVHCHPRMLFNSSKHSVMMTGPENRIPINK